MIVVFAQEMMAFWVFSGNFEKYTNCSPRFFVRMGKNDAVWNCCATAFQQAPQAKPVHSPVSTAGDEWQDCLSFKKSWTVAINERQNWAAGVVRPGWPGKDN